MLEPTFVERSYRVVGTDRISRWRLQGRHPTLVVSCCTDVPPEQVESLSPTVPLGNHRD